MFATNQMLAQIRQQELLREAEQNRWAAEVRKADKPSTRSRWASSLRLQLAA
jgi:hypothetical protein